MRDSQRRDPRGDGPARPGRDASQPRHGRPAGSGGAPRRGQRDAPASRPAEVRAEESRGRPGGPRGAGAARGSGAGQADGPAAAGGVRHRTPSPALPEEARAEVLPAPVRQAVAGLGGTAAEAVGRHLAAAGLLIDEDPAAALAHALAAKARAPRLAEVREAVGVAAYASGDFPLARAELRAARRMSGGHELIALLADCERALGSPERALALAAEAAGARLDVDDQIELAIVVSGARRDLGQTEAAVQALGRPELRRGSPDALLRLDYATAEAMLAAGRVAEATDWFGRAAAEDDDGQTDAAERLLELGRPG